MDVMFTLTQLVSGIKASEIVFDVINVGIGRAQKPVRQ